MTINKHTTVTVRQSEWVRVNDEVARLRTALAEHTICQRFESWSGRHCGECKGCRALAAARAELEAERYKSHGWPEMYREYEAMRKRLAAVEAVVDALPKCKPWLSGSGGHKQFGKCPNVATWTDYGKDVCFVEWYCDEHIPKAHATRYEESNYAGAVRALQTTAGGSGSRVNRAPDEPQPSATPPYGVRCRTNVCVNCDGLDEDCPSCHGTGHTPTPSPESGGVLPPALKRMQFEMVAADGLAQRVGELEQKLQAAEQARDAAKKALRESEAHRCLMARDLVELVGARDAAVPERDDLIELGKAVDTCHDSGTDCKTTHPDPWQSLVCMVGACGSKLSELRSERDALRELVKQKQAEAEEDGQ